jgi:hypothetical protein
MKNMKNVLAALLFASVVPLLAHNGFDHLTGTVTAVTEHGFTLKTSTRTVEVKLDDKTEFTGVGVKAHMTHLKPGQRVTVDVPEGSKDFLAHAVKIGTTGAAAAHDDAHDHHQ